jgi:hypothetical protein
LHCYALSSSMKSELGLDIQIYARSTSSIWLWYPFYRSHIMPLSSCRLLVHLPDLSGIVRLSRLSRLPRFHLTHQQSFRFSVLSCIVFACAMQAKNSLCRFHGEFLFLVWKFSVPWPLCRRTDLCSPGHFIASSVFINIGFEIVCVIEGSWPPTVENDHIERLDRLIRNAGLPIVALEKSTFLGE